MIEINILIFFLFKGCLKQFEQFLHDHILIVGGVGIGIAFVQVCI